MLSSKESTGQCRRRGRCGFDPWVRKILCRRKWQPTPVFLPEKFQRQRILVGFNSRVRKESVTTEHACKLQNEEISLDALKAYSLNAPPGLFFPVSY